MIRSLLLATLALTGTACSGAASPLIFQINMEVPANSPQMALRGASLQINGSWDYAALTPLAVNDHRTVWPSTNTIASLVVSGSQASDGVYAGLFFASSDYGWILGNSIHSKHSIEFPLMSFNAGATTISASLRATFIEPLFNTDGAAHPQSFSSARAIWASPNQLTNISGFATLVPEPSSFALAAVAIASLTALRRRE